MKTPDEIKDGLEDSMRELLRSANEGYPDEMIDSMENAHARMADALSYIQQLEAANAELLTKTEQLETKCHQLERERDALAADFKLYRERNIKGDCGAYACDLCKYGGKYEGPCPQGCTGINHWVWRGMKEEKHGQEI